MSSIGSRLTNQTVLKVPYNLQPTFFAHHYWGSCAPQLCNPQQENVLGNRMKTAWVIFFCLLMFLLEGLIAFHLTFSSTVHFSREIANKTGRKSWNLIPSGFKNRRPKHGWKLEDFDDVLTRYVHSITAVNWVMCRPLSSYRLWNPRGCCDKTLPAGSSAALVSFETKQHLQQSLSFLPGRFAHWDWQKRMCYI